MGTRPLKFWGILALIGLMLSSCWFMGPTIRGNGKVTEEVREVGDFDQVEVSRGMNVYLTQGSPAKVVVIADNNLHEVIVTEVEGDVLKVKVDGNIREAKEMKVMVTVESLRGIKTTSGSNVYSQSSIKAEDIELSANAGSGITMECNAEYLKAEASSGAQIKLSGLARKSELESSSGAILKAEALKSESCRMKASGGGSVFATVVKQMEARTTSGGNITYYGEPESTDIDSSSGGNVNHQ